MCNRRVSTPACPFPLPLPRCWPLPCTCALIAGALLAVVRVVPSFGQQPDVAPAQASSASAEGPLVIPKIPGTVELDGRPGEAAWEEARRLPFVQDVPDFGKDPTEKTEILVGYSEKALYVACRCYDRKAPSAPSFKRDYLNTDTDHCGIRLDTFNDNENALGFFTTPTGLRMDLAVFNDASGQLPLDIDWNSFWEAEATQNGEGWFAEMRIPVSSLRFDARGGQAVMGLSAGRLLARKSEEIVFPEIPPKWGVWSSWKPSQYRDVVFEDLEPETPFRVTPYLLGGVGQQSVLNDAETAYERRVDLRTSSSSCSIGSVISGMLYIAGGTS